MLGLLAEFAGILFIGAFLLVSSVFALQILSSVSREATLSVAIVERIRLSSYHAQF